MAGVKEPVEVSWKRSLPVAARKDGLSNRDQRGTAFFYCDYLVRFHTGKFVHCAAGPMNLDVGFFR